MPYGSYSSDLDQGHGQTGVEEIDSEYHPPKECAQCDAYFRHVCLSPPPCEFHLDNPVSTYAGRSFSDGINVGRRLQLDEDDSIFSRYRGRLDVTRKKLDDALLLKARSCDEADLLRTELAEAKDRLLAVQMAYQELLTSRADGSNLYPRDYFTEWDDQPSSDVGRDLLSSERVETLEQRTTQEQEHADSQLLEDLWSSDTNSFKEEEEFDILQQLQLMEEWDKEDAILFHRHHQQSSEPDIERSPVSDTFDLLDTESDLSTSPSGSNVALAMSSEPESEESNIPLLTSLMDTAHQPGNESALSKVRSLIHNAERTPRNQRTAEQLYLLLHWRSPSRSPASSSSSSVSIQAISLPSEPFPHISSTPEVFVDASFYGIGLVFNNNWLAWTFTPGHPLIPAGSRDGKPIMSWAELIAVELGVRTLLAAGYRNRTVILRSDNTGVIEALHNKKWTPKYDLDAILQRILRLCQDGGMVLRPRWVWTKVNPADKPSRGVYPPRSMMLPHRPEVPEHLAGLIQGVDDVSTT